MPKKFSQSEIDAATAELKKIRKEWLKRPGVTAVDVGYKFKGGKMTDELAIRVHVKRKMAREAVPEYEMFPKHMGKFKVDVIEAEYGPSLPAGASAELMTLEAVDRRDRLDPMVGGISVGNPRVTAGTLGAIVWDRASGDVCMLSNWHVLCGDPSCTAGEPIYQPGPADGGTATDTVAELLRWRLDQDADAAIARLNGVRGHSRDIVDLNPIPGIEEASLGMTVTKSGRTTEVTEGVVDGVHTSVNINYGSAGVVTLHDQIHIVPLPPWPAVDYEVSRGGDSGSCWINKATGKAVGLHFAGELDPTPSAENAIANRMVKVAEILNFSFTPIFQPPFDDRWRDIIRRILCRRYPWLCYPWDDRPYFPFGEYAHEPSRHSQHGMGGGCMCQTRVMREPTREMPHAAIEGLLDEMMDELRKRR